MESPKRQDQKRAKINEKHDPGQKKSRYFEFSGGSSFCEVFDSSKPVTSLILDPTPDEKINFVFEPEDSHDVRNGDSFEPDTSGRLADFVPLPKSDAPEKFGSPDLVKRVGDFGESCVGRIRDLKEEAASLRSNIKVLEEKCKVLEDKNARLRIENDRLRKKLEILRNSRE